MMKKLLLSSAAVLLLAGAAPAQQAGKVLFVIGNHINQGVQRAAQLKKAGFEVSVVFEREAVLALIQDANLGDSQAWRDKIAAIEKEFDVESSTEVRGRFGAAGLRHPKFALLGKPYRRAQPGKSVLDDLKKESIPYTVCSATANRMYEAYDELKAAGLPMSPDKEQPVDLSPYITQGYQVIVY